MPVILAIAVENDEIRILFRGVGSIRHMQYMDIENSRHWRDEGFDCTYATGADGFVDKENIDSSIKLGMDDFVMTIKTNDVAKDIERVLTQFTKMKLLTPEQSRQTASQLNLDL